MRRVFVVNFMIKIKYVYIGVYYCDAALEKQFFTLTCVKELMLNHQNS